MEPVYIFVLVIDFTKKWGFRRENNHFLLSCWTFLTRKWVFFLKNEYFFSKMSTLKSEMTKRLK